MKDLEREANELIFNLEKDYGKNLSLNDNIDKSLLLNVMFQFANIACKEYYKTLFERSKRENIDYFLEQNPPILE